MAITTNQTILIVGGGISGMTAAIEAAEIGKNVILIEKRPFIGGRVSQIYKYFPKLCFPTCGLEINQKRIKQNSNINILTMSEVSSIKGVTGDYEITIKTLPRYINEKCTACGDCAAVATSEIDNEFNYNLNKRKVAYLPYSNAYPLRYVIDESVIKTDEGKKIAASCKVGAVDLDMQESETTLKVATIIWATGWQPFDADKIRPYGHDRFDNVISSVEFERMMDPMGPTAGKLVRPSDGTEAKNVAFVQCAGSRDHNYLKHCSRICCMATLKQTTYITDTYEDGKADIYYIDIRAIDRFEDFYQKIKNKKNVNFIKSKVASITENKENKNPILNGVDTEGYHRYANSYDMVVLAVGMQPAMDTTILPDNITINEHGFMESNDSNGGMFAAGCASDALDVNRSVQSATAAALKAVQIINSQS
jgi:quinone-modifying oxidoreductase subunit QmoA